MSETHDLLRGELERLFELEEMTALSTELLGYSPGELGDADGKGAFARALVSRCANDHALEALADAMLLFGQRSANVSNVFNVRGGQSIAPGTVIAGYKITKTIGEGGLGTVYLAEKGEGDARVRVALKIIRSSLARDPSAVARYLTGQRAYRRAGIDGIAKVHDCGILEDGRPWVASEFVDGQTLAGRVSRIGPMHINEAKPIFVSLLEALQASHEAGLVHADVKSGNVFMVRKENKDGSRSEPVGVLVDGGAQKLLAAGATRPDAIGALRVFGSAQAIAPEMARGESVNAASDVYALGVMLYEVLTGEVPFKGTSAFEVIAKHLSESPKAPSEIAPKGWITPELDELVLKTLAKDAGDRFADARELKDAFKALTKSKAKAEKLDDKAFDKAKKALLKDPAKDGKANALEEVISPAHAWDKGIKAFEEAIEKAKKDGAKKSLLFRIARIQNRELEDHEKAIATYQKILEIDENDDLARGSLEEIYRNRGDFEALADHLLEGAERAASEADRAALLREIAEIYEDRMSDPDNALVAWTQALADEPDSPKTIRAIERIAGENAERWNEVLASLSEEVQEVDESNTENTVKLYCAMANWYGSALKRPDFALPCYAKAIELDPGCEKAYDGTLELYERAQSWQESVQLLEHRANNTPNKASARDFRAQAAEIVRTKLSDQERAVSLFKDILKEDGGHPAALLSLGSIYEDRKEWAELQKLLKEQVKQASGDAKVAAHLKIAELNEDRLRDLDAAIVEYEAAASIDPGNVDALRGLSRVYAQGSKFDKLLQVLERQLEATATPRQRIAVLEQIGSIQEEEFVDQDKAIESFEAVVAIDAGHDGANSALARLYRQKGRFDDLVATLERHANATEDAERKTALQLQAAKTLLTDVGSPDRALEFAEKVLATNPEHTDALPLVARIKAQSGDANAAVEAVDRMAKSESDPKKRAERYVEAATILEDAGNVDGAIDRYKRALDADEDNALAAESLRRLYGARGDAHGAVELLKRELEGADGKTRKAELHAELGALYLSRLDDPAKARQSFQTALDLDGTALVALRGLGDIAFEQEDWPTASRAYEPLLSRLGELDGDAARDLAVRCGDAFRAQEKFDKAQRAYLNAKAYAKNDRAVLERVAEVTFEGGEADQAAELYRELIEKAGADLDAVDRGRILFRQGDAMLRSNQVDDAIKSLKEAAELLPADGGPMSKLADAYEQKGEFDKVVQVLRDRMEMAEDDERFDLLVRVGDVLHEKLADSDRGAKSYVAALEIKPEDRNLLTKLMGVYSGSKDWSRLVEVILRIADLVTDERQLAKYYVTAASIAHKELKQYEEAAGYYAQTLEYDPGLQRAFDGRIACLKEAGRFDDLADAYQARLQQGGLEAADKAAIYDELGDVYRTHLDDSAKAAEAFAEAQELDPGKRNRLEKMVEIYEGDPKRFYRQALETHQQLLASSPYRIESYRALKKLYEDLKRDDEAWCVAQTLVTLEMADADEKKLFKAKRSKHPAAAQEFMTEGTWFNHIIHPQQDPLLTGIFAAITPAVIATRSQALSAYDVKESDKRDVASDESKIVQTLGYVAGVTQIETPDVYYRNADPGGLSMLFTNPPGVGVGKATLAGGPPQALAYLAARHLSYFRPGHNLRQIVPSGSGLRGWLLGAIKFATPQFPVPGSMTQKVDASLAAIKEHVGSDGQAKVRDLVQKLLAAAPELDMKRWVAAVDFTADRLGFIMSNNLEISVALIKATPDDGQQKERLKQLYLYSVSSEYLELREKLGIAID